MNWKVESGYLVRTFKMKSFDACVDLLNKVANLAKEIDHHPDVTIEKYRFISFKLRSHEEDGITQKDIEMARAIDTL